MKIPTEWTTTVAHMKIPTEWTTTERIDMATTLLRTIRNDVLRERYGCNGHPDILMVFEVLHDNPINLRNRYAQFKRTLEASGVVCD